MRASRLDRLFDRFRRKGDAKALGLVFDATAPELFRIAVHLMKDLDAAEDLLQETFLTAIHFRERYQLGYRLKPWLVGILTNKVREEKRRRRWPIEPDRLVPRAETDPGAQAEADELSACIERALARLSSCDREVVDMALREGKSPQEIALALGRAPGTVRVQLHRGLERLRKLLPAGLVPGVAVPPLRLRGFSDLRAAVVRAAETASQSVAVGSAAAPAALLLGGIAVNVKGIAAAVGIAASLGWLATDVLRSQDPSTEGSTAVADGSRGVLEPTTLSLKLEKASDTAERIRAEVAPFARPTPATEESAAAPLAAEGRVFGHLLLPGGEAASEASVALLKFGDGIPSSTVAEGATRGNGAFRLFAPAGNYLLAGTCAGCLPLTRSVTIAAGVEATIEPLSFSPGVPISGQVRVLEVPPPIGSGVLAASPIRGIRVTVAGETLVWSEGRLAVPTRRALTDVQGRYSIEGLEPGPYRLLLEAPPGMAFLRASREVVAPTSAADLDVDGAHLVVSTTSEGRAIDAGITLALIEGTRKDVLSRLHQPEGSVSHLFVPASCEIEITASADGYTHAVRRMTAPAAGETEELLLDLAANRAELVVDLVAPGGKTFSRAGFALFLLDDGAGTFVPSSARTGPDGKYPVLVRDARTDGGSFRLVELPEGRYEIAVRADAAWEEPSSCWLHDRIVVDLSRDAPAHLRVALALGGRLRLRCLDRSATPLSNRCQIFDPSGQEVPVTFFTVDGRGSVWGSTAGVIPNAPGGFSDVDPTLPPGRYEIRFTLDRQRIESRVATVLAGETTVLDLVVDSL